MIHDLMTLMVKEWKELFRLRGNLRGGTLGLALFLCVFGILLPVQMGRAWVEEPMVLYFWVWVPLFLVSSVVADSFAGERERNTLETLLASRLSDRAILAGKTLAAMSYGWGLTLISMALSMVTLNLTCNEGGFLFYDGVMCLGAFPGSLLGAGLAAGAGVLVSLRASTVRQAQQTLSIVLMMLLFVPLFGYMVLPDDVKIRIIRWFSDVSLLRVVLIVEGALLVIDGLLFSAALVRFRRERLILD